MPAFPGAQGFGAIATGGRGGEVYHVTKLDDYDSGEAPIKGTLRYGIEVFKEKLGDRPLTIVFDVGGEIRLKGDDSKDGLLVNKLRITGLKNITIAGQTAPGAGITIRDGGLKIEDSENIILRYVRLRVGDAKGGNVAEDDALSIDDSSRIVVDHVSASWSMDETVSVQNSEDVTVQWSFLTEPLNRASHNEGEDDPQEHAYGGLVSGDRISYHHNLYAHVKGRAPQIGGGNVEWTNNVLYNWSIASIAKGAKIRYVGNYLKAGADLNSASAPVFAQRKPDAGETVDRATVYQANNFFDKRLTRKGWDLFRNVGKNDPRFDKAKSPGLSVQPHVRIKEDAAKKAYDNVLKKAGSSRVRDKVDLRIVDEVKLGKGRIIDSPWSTKDGRKAPSWTEWEAATRRGRTALDSYGFPVLAVVSRDKPTTNDAVSKFDTDQDGMPNWWEKAKGLKLDDSSDGNADRNNDGYTNLEEYLNSLAD